MILEICWHARANQGSITVAKILAEAALAHDLCAQVIT